MFVLGLILLTDVDLYFISRLKDKAKVLLIFKISWSLEELSQTNNIKNLPPLDKIKLLYHINKVINVHYLYILPLVTSDIFVIAHWKGYPSFSYYYKIITCFWFIWGLIKLLWAFIYYCPQCLALEIRRYTLYNSL